MRLKRIRLRRVPGIDPEFTLEQLGEGINVVVGPNGSGKTSMCKALAATLWPGRDSSKKLEVETLWQDGEQALSAERDGAQVRWQRDGVAAEPPSLPDENLAACYTMGVRDLLVGGDDTDGEIARDIRVQMSGGYDLRQVEAQHFALKATHGRGERSQRDKAETRLRAVQQKFRELACDEDRLDELSRAERDAQAAQAEVGRLERAVELADARQALATSQAELERFPQRMDCLRSEDLETLAELEKKRERSSTELAENAEKLEQAQAAIKASGLSDTRPDEAQLEACLGRLERADSVSRDSSAAEQLGAMARAKRQSARESLGVSGEPPPFAKLSSEALDQAESLLNRASALRDKYVGVKAQIELITVSEDGEEADDLAALSRASDALRNWLASPASADLGLSVWQIAVAAVVTLLSTALTVYDSLHDWAWMFLAGAAATITVAGLLLRLRRVSSDGGMNQHWEREFEQLAIAAVPQWRHDAVCALLRRLDERCARAKAGEQRRDQLPALRQRLGELKREEAELLTARRALRDELGLDVDCRIDSDLTLWILGRRWRDCDEAAAAAAEAEAKVGVLSAAGSEIRGGLLRFLAEYGQSCDDDLSEIRARLGDLQRRLRSYDSACSERSNCVGQLERARAEEQDALKRIAEFYAERALDTDARRSLEERLRQLDRYTETLRQRDYQQRRVGDGEAHLADHAQLLGLSTEEAEARLEQARGKVLRLTEISAEIGSIRGRIAEAGRQAELETAQAELAQANDRLNEVCEEARAVVAGSFLLEEVDREHEKVSRPAVLARAMEYFAAFTHNAYELLLPEGEGAQFRALDTSSGQGLAISQLSEGTRIQLLLAVRVAFAISAERGCRLPLVFDEVLSTADPRRFDAIAESLCVLAGEDRQIFYLTSNPSDATRWERVCGARDGAELHVIDLGKLRGGQAAINDIAEIEISELPELPRPDGLSPERYAIALKVPPVDPYANFTRLHLFYVLRDDLDTLDRLIRQFHLSTVGQWCSLAKSGRAERLLGSRLCARIDALCLCAAAVHEAWQVGRGKPVSRGVLEDSGAVSQTYIDRIVDLSRDLGGDGERLITAISDRSDERAKGFRGGPLAVLNDYLEEQGYIDRSPVLDLSSIYSRSLDAARDAVKAEIVDESECASLVTGLLAMLERHAGPARDVTQAELEGAGVKS